MIRALSLFLICNTRKHWPRPDSMAWWETGLNSDGVCMQNYLLVHPHVRFAKSWIDSVYQKNTTARILHSDLKFLPIFWNLRCFFGCVPRTLKFFVFVFVGWTVWKPGSPQRTVLRWTSSLTWWCYRWRSFGVPSLRWICRRLHCRYTGVVFFSVNN